MSPLIVPVLRTIVLMLVIKTSIQLAEWVIRVGDTITLQKPQLLSVLLSRDEREVLSFKSPPRTSEQLFKDMKSKYLLRRDKKLLKLPAGGGYITVKAMT